MQIIQNHRLRYLKRYLIYYIAIIIIPLCVIIFSYSDSYRNALNTARENQIRTLSSSAQLCDSYLKGAQNLAYEFTSNYVVKQYVQQQAPNNDNTVIADIYRLQQMFAPYLATNHYIYEMQLFFPKSNTIITSKSTYNRLQTFYELYYEDLFSRYSEWYDWYFSDENQGFGVISLPYNHVTTEYLYYKENFSDMSVRQSAGIYILLDPGEIVAPLEAVGGDWSFFVSDEFCFGTDFSEAAAFYQEYSDYLTDYKGYFFTDIEGDRYLVTYQKSGQVDGVYFSCIAEKEILSSLRGIRTLFFIIVLMTVVIVLGLAVVFAAKTAAPWLGIVRLLEGEESMGEELSKDYVNQQISRVIQNNKSLAVQVEEWQPAVRSALFYKLLFGGFVDADEAIAEFNKIGMDIRGHFYAVIILTINEVDVESGLSELNAYQVVINEYLTRKLYNLKGIYATDIENEVLILTSDEENYVVFVEELEKQFRAVARYAQEECSLSVSFSGSLANSLNRIPSCYYEAKTAQGYEAKLNDLNIVWFKKGKPIEKISFYYPVTAEMQLTSAVTKGNNEETQRILLRIAKENEQLLADHSDIYLQLLYTMNATIYRIVGENVEIKEQLEKKMDALAKGLKNGRNLEKVFQQIYDIFLDLCCHFTTGLLETQPLYNQIREFIHQNYTNHQLSLAMIAEEFHITEIYFSRLFKEKNGKNYSKYVEELRMEEASRLLEETDLSIQAIAEKVGYNSPQSFRRVYKKFFGHTPRGK